MKRKLISFDVFKKIEEQSLTNAQKELIEAQDVLAEALGVEGLELFTFGESEVTYETPDGTYIHATYTIKDDSIILENIEQLVIDQESEKNSNRSIISKMVDSIIDNKDATAAHQFEQYMSSPSVKRSLNEATWKVTSSRPTGRHGSQWRKHRNRSAVAKGVRSRLKTLARMSPSQKKQLARERARARKRLGGSSNPRARVYARKIKKSHMKEWNNLVENVINYINYKNFGPAMNESFVRQDNNGEINAIAVPTALKRNEGKVLSFNWDTLDHEVKVVRSKMKNVKEDNNFVKAMADLKRYNNISDNSSLETTLEAIVTRWPDLIYVTEEELATQISHALESAAIKNYDDEICSFMAEAILRTAHNAYTDRVKKIAVLAGVEDDITAECRECEDAYGSFKKVVEQFYVTLDESESKELQVFVDLFNALREVREIAVEAEDSETVRETEDLLEQCAAVLNKESKMDLELAEEVADYISYFLEANIDGASNDWDVVTTPHHTVYGDHPYVSKMAKVDGTPSVHNGDWKSAAPVSDGKSYNGDLDDEMQSNGWSNLGGNDIWPSLDNPYVPKASDYKMKEKSVVDDGDELAQNQSNDTWPNLNNPYVKGAVMPRDVK